MAKRPDRITAWMIVGGRAHRECEVLDVAPGGAKLVVQDGSGIPDRFELAFFHDFAKRQKCEVIWRRGKMLGVRFMCLAAWFLLAN